MYTDADIEVRTKLKEDLAWLGFIEHRCITVFRRLYAHNDDNLSISDIIDKMSPSEIKNAVRQVYLTIEKRR